MSHHGLKRGLIVAGAALAALFVYRRANASSSVDQNGTPVLYSPNDFAPDGSLIVPDMPMGDVAPVDNSAPIFDFSTVDYMGAPIPVPDTTMTTPQQNLDAFLFMIRASEHRYPQDVVGTDIAYQTFYGGKIFNDLSDHPVITGELKGVTLPPDMCRAAGYPGGVCVSTAAGAYQITRPTWNAVRQAGAWGPRLNDFSKASQDEAARRLLVKVGAAPYIDTGDFANAIARASGTWASLPGSKAQQNPKSMDYALARIDEAIAQGYA